MTQNMKKDCLVCGKTIIKKPNWSVNAWKNRVKYCSRFCKYKTQFGRKILKTVRLKMSIAHIGKSSWNKGIPATELHKKRVSESLKKEKHWNWKGGITEPNHALRTSIFYKEWREAVFKRDNFKCKMNNSDCVHEIHAHHILRFADYPELRFDINNGITLCESHHPMKKIQEQKLVPIFQSLIAN